MGKMGFPKKEKLGKVVNTELRICHLGRRSKDKWHSVLLMANE